VVTRFARVWTNSKGFSAYPWHRAAHGLNSPNGVTLFQHKAYSKQKLARLTPIAAK